MKHRNQLKIAEFKAKIFSWIIDNCYYIFVIMKIDTEKLTTISNFARKKGFSRQWMHKLIQAGQFDTVYIDGVAFVKEKKVTK